MLGCELKKIFIKQYAFVFIAFIVIVDIIFFANSYTENRFDSKAEKTGYHNYIDVLKGKMDDRKEKFILTEQEKILNAQINLKLLQNRLYSGEIADKNEYITEFMEIQNELSKSAAFDIIYTQYKYIKEKPDNRYFIPLKKIGFCRDYPDVVFLLFIILFSAECFLNEETSRMIILIRTCESSRKNTFYAKFFALFLIITSAHTLISLTEYIFLAKTLGNDVIHYPVQSLEYFGGCEYSLTILQSFILIQAIKFFGYFFIAALTVLISVLNKKPLFTVSIPMIICILQQFIFQNSDNGYYLPTGLLRAVGYLRGDAYETVVDYANVYTMKVFSSVPIYILFTDLIITAITILVSICIGNTYYKKKKTIKKYTICGAAIVLVSVLLSGCNNNISESECVWYNLKTSSLVSQNAKYFFHQSYEGNGCGVTAVGLNDNSEFKVIHEPFDNEYWTGSFCIAGNSIYTFRRIALKDFVLYKTDLDSFEYKIIARQETKRQSAFLGLKEKNKIIIDKGVSNFFTNETDNFFVTEDNEVYKTDMTFNEVECIISDGIYNGNLVYNGRMIYYINNLMELVEYNIKTGERKIISENFVVALDLNEDSIIFSDRNGIFSFMIKNGTKKRLSDISAESIFADGDKIVYMFNNKLYLISNGNAFELYDEPVISFGLIRGENKVIYSKYIYETQSIENYFIDISNYG